MSAILIKRRIKKEIKLENKLKELNPCPQCGGKAFLFSYRNVIFSYRNINLERPHYVRCSSCFRKSENYATREEAVEAWNDCK